MSRTFLSSVLVLAVFATIARAEMVYVSWQSPDSIGAYDLATGNQVTPPNFPALAKARGIAVSPLDGLVYVGFDSATGISSYDPLTGAVADSNVGNVGSKVWGLCFDSSGNMYASHAADGKIAKLTPNGSGGFNLDADWSAPPTTGTTGQVNDLTIYNGKLYSARYYGISVCDLTGSNEGVESWIAGGNGEIGGPIGVAFDDNGTLYSAHLESKQAWKWSSDYTSHEVLGSFPTHIQDIDYYDGYLYVKGKMSSNGDQYGVFKYDLKATSPTWELLVTAPAVMEWVSWTSLPTPSPNRVRWRCWLADWSACWPTPGANVNNIGMWDSGWWMCRIGRIRHLASSVGRGAIRRDRNE